MAQNLKLKNFLRKVQVDLLKKYLSEKGFTYEINQDSLSEKELDDIQTEFESLNFETQSKIEIEIQQITDMADENSIQIILELATTNKDELTNQFGLLEDSINQSFYTFLYNQEHFYKAYSVDSLTLISSKKIRAGLKKVEISSLIDRKDMLMTGISTYLQKKDGRGEKCQIDPYILNGRICFFVYAEDYTRQSLHFNEIGLQRSAIKPSLEIVFVYFDKSGRLEIYAKGKAKRIDELSAIFNKEVLQDENPIPKQKPFLLKKALESSFDLRVNPQDNIESVFLKHIQLKETNGETRIEITIDSGATNKTILNELTALHINLNKYFVNQATFKFKFASERRNQGSVTMRLSFPDLCSLNDSELHQKASKYIEEWGLYDENSIA